MDTRVVGLAGLIGTAFVCGTPAAAAVLKVPQQYATIQAAVDAAQEGDTVRVAAGNYPERVRITDKAIALDGAGAEQTTIDATASGRPLTVSTTGTGQVTVSGFTLKNGRVSWEDVDTEPFGPGRGGGVYAENTNMALLNNVITNNRLFRRGTCFAASREHGRARGYDRQEQSVRRNRGAADDLLQRQCCRGCEQRVCIGSCSGVGPVVRACGVIPRTGASRPKRRHSRIAKSCTGWA